MFYDRSVTDEGVTVLSERMEGVRSVALGVWIAAGSRDEKPDEAGISHFIEHMMFKGTSSKDAKQISEAFDRLGAEVNAFTSKEYTCYFSRVLDQHADEAFALLGDMVSNSLMEESCIKSEREVVLEEISRHEDTPDDKVHDLFATALWGDQPIGRMVLGRPDTVSSFSPADVFKYTGRRYGTGDVVVAAAGNLQHADLLKLTSDRLALKGKKRADRGKSSRVKGSGLEVFTKDTEQAHIAWGCRGVSSTDDERFALSVLDGILGGGMSSRLFQEIREKRGLAYAVFSYHATYLDTGSFTVYAGTRPDNTKEVLDLIRTEADRLLDSGVTDDEMARSKESIKGQLVLSLEASSHRMMRLGKSEVTHGEILSIDELVEKIDAVDREDVMRIARKTLGGPRVLAMVGPFEAPQVQEMLG